MYSEPDSVEVKLQENRPSLQAELTYALRSNPFPSPAFRGLYSTIIEQPFYC